MSHRAFILVLGLATSLAVSSALAQSHGRAVGQLPDRQQLVKRVLESRRIPTFNAAYPDDLPLPTALQKRCFRFPFKAGTPVVCQQGNNTMATPASHAPDGLRYALDFSQGEQTQALPILAPNRGTAYVYSNARVNKPDNWGFGNFVLIDQGNGYCTMLCHLDQIQIRNGQKVKAGQQVGTLGTTGSAGNAHLHIQMNELLRTPDPAREMYHAEFGGPLPSTIVAPPFGTTVPYITKVFNLTTGQSIRLRTTDFVGAEAGVAWDIAHWYQAP